MSGAAILERVEAAWTAGDPLTPRDLLAEEAYAVRRLYDEGLIENREHRFGATFVAPGPRAVGTVQQRTVVKARRRRELRSLLLKARGRGRNDKDEGVDLAHPALLRQFRKGRRDASLRRLEELYFEGYSEAEIARMTGRTARDVRKRFIQIAVSYGRLPHTRHSGRSHLSFGVGAP